MGFVGEDVESRAGNPVLGEGLHERVLVDDRAASDVDEEAVRAERVEDIAVDEVSGAVSAWREDDHDITEAGEIDWCRGIRPGDVLRGAGVIGDVGAQGAEAFGCCAADPTQSQDSDPGAADLASQREPFSGSPFPGPDEPVGRRDSAKDIEDEGDGEVGDSVVEDVRGVRHHDPAPSCLGDVDVVVADPIDGDRFEPREGVHLSGADGGAGADDRHGHRGRVRDVCDRGRGIPIGEPVPEEGHEGANDGDSVLGWVLRLHGTHSLDDGR